MASTQPDSLLSDHRRQGSQAPAANGAAIAAPMPSQCRRECGAADEACETETSELTRCASASGNSGSAWRSHAVRKGRQLALNAATCARNSGLCASTASTFSREAESSSPSTNANSAASSIIMFPSPFGFVASRPP
jgi:hypothetical protein